MDAKPLRIKFNKVDEISKIYNGIRYLELSNSYNEDYYRIYDVIFDRITYVISEKVVLQIVKLIEKKLTFYNVITLINSVVTDDKNNYHYNIFLEKDLYKEFNTQYF